MAMRSLKWENTGHEIKSTASGINEIIEVSYNNINTNKHMRPDCLGTKIQKYDSGQLPFIQATSGEKNEEYWKVCKVK